MASPLPQAPRHRRFFRIRYILIASVIGIYIWSITREQPFFNDTNYANLSHDLGRTLAYEKNSPEQTAAYIMLGKHLKKPIYFDVTGMDLCRWLRDPENSLRPLLRKHRQLENDWETKGADGLSNADHYNGFVAGPVSAARILFQESAPELLDSLNNLLRKLAGTDPIMLDLMAQEALVWKAFVQTPEGREMNATLTSRRLLWDQAEGYNKMKNVAGIPGIAARWLQHNFLMLLIGVIVIRRGWKVVRGKQTTVECPPTSECPPVSQTHPAKLDESIRRHHSRKLLMTVIPVLKNVMSIPTHSSGSKRDANAPPSPNAKLDQSRGEPVGKPGQATNDNPHQTSTGRPTEVVIPI